MDERVSVPFDTVFAAKGPPARWSSGDVGDVPLVMRVVGNELDGVAEELRNAGLLVYRLPSDIRDAAAFMRAMRKLMPLDPPFDGKHDDDPNWDALADSLSGGLHQQTSADRIAIVWPTPREGASPELEEAMSVLAQVAHTLRKPEHTLDRPRQVLVLTTGHVAIRRYDD